VAFLGESLRSLLLREPTASVAWCRVTPGPRRCFIKGWQKSDVPSLRRVARHEFTFAAGVDVTDVMQVKGLEFDYVVLLDATSSAYPDTIEARHLLHIAITRCAHQLWLLSTSQPSPLIAPSVFCIEEYAPYSAASVPAVAVASTAFAQCFRRSQFPPQRTFALGIQTALPDEL
jgi:DNA helicase-2/ATP-dependent DNA helicase PcrA